MKKKEFKELTFDEFIEKNIAFFEEWFKEFKNSTKNNPDCIRINFKQFCYTFCSYFRMPKKDGIILDLGRFVNKRTGKFFLSYLITHFISKYRSNLINVNNDKLLNMIEVIEDATEKNNDLRKSLSLFFFSALELEGFFIDSYYKLMKKTTSYINLTDKQKNSIKKYGEKLLSEKLNKIKAYDLNEELTKRDIALNKKIGIKKQLLKPFINFYQENKEMFGTADKCFETFKVNHDSIKNDSFETFRKLIYKNRLSLKNVYPE